MDYAITYDYYPNYWMIMEGNFQYESVNVGIGKDIDKVLCDINIRNPVKLRECTPDILVKNGVNNLPMYENPAHIRKNVLTEQEARKLGLAINNKDHYHGLGKELYIKAIASLDNPRVVFKNKIYNNEFLILTMIKDSNNNNIIIPIEVNTKTKVDNLLINVNRVKTVYGYNRKYPNLNKYIKDNLNANKLDKIYEKKNPSTNITSQLDSSISNIPQVNINVKYDISNNSNM